MKTARTAVLATLFVLFVFSSNSADAVSREQVRACYGDCPFVVMEQIAVANRYASTSVISVFNDRTLEVITFKVVDSSEPGQTIIRSTVVPTPWEVSEAAQMMKDLHTGMLALGIYSPYVSQGIVMMTPLVGLALPMPPPKSGGVASSCKLPTSRDDPHFPRSASQMDDPGAREAVAGWVRGNPGMLPPQSKPQAVRDAFEYIFMQSHLKTVTCMFEDGSTVTLILDTVFKTDSWKVLPETAVKNGVQVLPNSGQQPQADAVRVTPSIGPGGEIVWPMKCHAYSILAERNGVQTTTTPQVCYFEP